MKGEILRDMGNHTKENKNKKKQLKLDSAKTSFVAGIIVFITIFKDLLEYLESELPLWLNGVYASVCLILVVLAFGTKILDKPLRKKETGLENSGNFLTIGSIFIFVFENTIFKIKMDTSQIIDVCLIYAFIVIGAMYLLFRKYEK